MIGFELKGVVVILLIISMSLAFFTYDEKMTANGNTPKNRFWILIIASISLFIYGLYLNECKPIVLF